MFDVERFVAECRAARAQDPTHKAVREVVARAVAEPRAVLKGLGEPSRAEIQKLYHSPELPVLNAIWGPQWAVIAIYTGREDNIYWRRLPGSRVEAASAQSLCERDAVPRAQRMGWGDAARAALRHRKDDAAVRRVEPALRA